MRTLIEKMEANAAERLALPPARTPSQELARYKNFLKVETHRLKILHRAGGNGLEICHARAALMDILLRSLWDAAVNSLTPQARKEFPPLSLVAIGGYGRAELNPHSDIDFMFLHDGRLVAVNRPLPHLARIIDGMLYPLWDIGLKVGHSVRSLDDCIKVANSDMQSKTSIIEARLITGHEGLYKKFQKLSVTKCVDGYEEAYIASRLEDQAARRAKYGNSACMQEPNLKNGCGGLRDYQNLLWMAFFKYRTRSLKDLEHRELISRAERRQLESAYDFLLRARNELHYQTGRPVDALLKSQQPSVAHYLGFTDRSPSRRIEKFMRELYTAFRNVYLITRTVEQRLALLPLPNPRRTLSLRKFLVGNRLPAITQQVDGFQIANGEISPQSPRVFRDQPRRLMRVFLHVQQRNLKMHPDLPQLIRNHVQLVDRDFQRDEHVRETFLTILGQRGNVASVLRAMHECELLGKYIPEFGKLTCLVQHEFYHQYAADEHTLVCLEKLDQIATASEPPFSNYTQLFQDLERPLVLYLALLLHDVGKADGRGEHSAVGSHLAIRVARRLGLDSGTTELLAILIEHHLLMARVSQRHDLDDPAVIRSFARQIQTPEALSLLTLLTFVDSQGTSDKLWSGFKETLLWTLHGKAAAVLAGATEFLAAEDKQRESLLREVCKLLPSSLQQTEAQAHFDALPPRYFQVHSAREIFDDVLLVHTFMDHLQDEKISSLAPVNNWHNDPDRGCNTVKVCTWDRPGLFSSIAGTLSATGLNILSARIFTRSDNLVLDTFFVTDAHTGGLASREQRDKFEQLLSEVLTSKEVDLYKLISRRKPAATLYQSFGDEQIPTSILFDNEISENRTAIEVETEDRVGLLFALSQTLAELGVDVSSAKINTEKGAAIDTFYATEAEGGKITAQHRQREIERGLLDAIKKLEPRK